MTSTTAEVEARRTNNGRTPTTKTTPKFPSSSRRRTPSFSSTSSLSSSNSSSSFRSFCQEDSPTSTPSSTPFLPFTSNGEGIPFSWESIPGIPKKPTLKKIDSSRKTPTTYLPLPPVLPTTNSTKSCHHNKKHILSTPRRDPFFTALVECSKADSDNDNDDDDDDHNKAVFGSIWKGAKSAKIRFGFVNTMSCKNSSAVTESLVFLPRAPRRIAYDMVKKRSG